jgi:riboflavin synthase
MFTGLIETTGEVLSLTETAQTNSARLTLCAAPDFVAALTLGDSLATNGCCLTVSHIDLATASISFDLLSQTLRVTSLGDLSTGSLVNLERAMQIGDRFGGHFVQGHVDATVTVLDWQPDGADYRLTVSLAPEHREWIIPKGSICLDGISLTAAEVTADAVTCWIIPHTLSVTHLKAMQPGRRMNVEFDMLGKYVARQLALRLNPL